MYFNKNCCTKFYVLWYLAHCFKGLLLKKKNHTDIKSTYLNYPSATKILLILKQLQIVITFLTNTNSLGIYLYICFYKYICLDIENTLSQYTNLINVHPCISSQSNKLTFPFNRRDLIIFKWRLLSVWKSHTFTVCIKRWHW